MTQPPVHRVVVLAPNWLGDAVMASPLLSLLARAEFPAAGRPVEVCLAIRREWALLFEGDPRLSRILPLQRNGRHSGLRGILTLASDLRALAADAVVLGPPSLRAGLGAALAGIPLRAGFRTDGRSPLLNRGVPFPGKGRGHYSQQLLALGRAVLRDWDGRADQEAAAGPLLPAVSAWPAPAPAEGPPLWALGVGATYGQAKLWPAGRVRDFLDQAVCEQQVRIVLLGDRGGREFAQVLRSGLRAPWRRHLRGGPGVVDLVGGTDLRQAVEVLRSAEAFVGNDSGLMHVAGALGLATVGVFGSSDPDWTAPLGPRTAAVAAAGFSCRPCFRPTCNQPRFCLEEVTAADVLQAVTDLLRRPDRAGGAS